MAVWPSTLKITRDGFTETAPDNIIRSSMDVGPAKIRKRFSANVRKISISLFLTPDEVEILDVFYLANSAAEFDFTHPRTEASVKCRFVSVPQYSASETMWNVSIDLEIMP